MCKGNIGSFELATDELSHLSHYTVKPWIVRNVFNLLKHTVLALTKSYHTSAIADHITSTGHNIKWDHFDV